MPKCKMCKVTLDFSKGDGYTHIPFIAQGNCFDCYHWDSVLNGATNRTSVRTPDGEHYCYPTNKPLDLSTPQRHLGLGGQKMKIKFFDGTEVVTNNLWSQGKMTKYWFKKFPANATVKSCR